PDTLPAGITSASFLQFRDLRTMDVAILAHSSVARSVFVTGSPTNPNAGITVDVKEISGIGAAEVTGGLTSNVIINPDLLNPDLLNPDLLNPDLLNPDLLNPDLLNPALAEVKDIIWTIVNKGNTTSAFTFKNFLSRNPGKFAFQLLVYKIHTTPAILPTQ